MGFAGQGIVAQSENWIVVMGNDVFPADSVVDNEGNVKDAIVGGILILFGALIVAFFGIDTVVSGLTIMWEAAKQIVSAILFHDVIPGPIAEDDTIHVIIFTVRDYLGLGNETGIVRSIRR